MIKHSQKTYLLYAIVQVNILWGKSRMEGERTREKGVKSERLSMAVKGFRFGNQFGGETSRGLKEDNPRSYHILSSIVHTFLH
jgi:hypothetical protein